MKTLIIIRHAKSGWDDPSLADHDRPLSERGLRDAPHMASHIAQHVQRPDRVYTSTAVRARTTAAFFAEAWSIEPNNVCEVEGLYLASRASLCGFVEELSDALHRVVLVGHNPGLSDLVAYYSADAITHLPTCSVVVLTFPNANSWSETGRGTGTVETFLYPKALL